MPLSDYCVDTGAYVPPSVSNNSMCMTNGLRYLDSTNNGMQQSLFNNWWKEQISQYGMKVNYYINQYSLSAHDYFYGEHPIAGFADPIEMIVCVTLSNDSIILSKFGLQGQADLTAVFAINSFTTSLTSSSLSSLASIYDYEPKSGDLIELSEYGTTRPNGRSGQIFEITERVDQKGGTNNQLMGHYIWMIQAKRYDYTYENNAPREELMDQVYDNKHEGFLNNLPKVLETKQYPQFVDKSSKQVFDYSESEQANTSVYGDYEDTSILVKMVGVSATAALGASADAYVVVRSENNE